MKIGLTAIYVDDQDKALRFYTQVAGFVKKADFSQGGYRWLTVASAEEPDGTELQLARNDNPAAKAYQEALFQQGQPAAMFFTDDVQRDYERMKAGGRRIQDAAYQGDRLDDRPSKRQLRKPDPDHAAEPLKQNVRSVVRKAHEQQGARSSCGGHRAAAGGMATDCSRASAAACPRRFKGRRRGGCCPRPRIAKFLFTGRLEPTNICLEY